MKFKNLTLLRHGRSIGNEGKIVHKEQQNILTSGGLADAIGRAMTFNKTHPGIKYDSVFCSPLPRALQTCYNFLSVLDHDPVDVVVVDDLRERCFGIEGYLPNATIEQLYGEGEVAKWFSDLEHRPCGKGETARELYQRASTVFTSQIAPRLRAGERVLVVSHYATMGALVAKIVDNDEEKTLSRKFTNARPYEYKVDITDSTSL